jgi:hypothetical protein
MLKEEEEEMVEENAKLSKIEAR